MGFFTDLITHNLICALRNHKQRKQREQDLARLEKEKSRQQLLSSGPVIVSTSGLIHRARYCETYGRAGGQVIVSPECPNPDPFFRPRGEYTQSRRHPGRGNSSYKLFSLAIAAGYIPCKFCYPNL
jgi:hypothetical protein